MSLGNIFVAIVCIIGGTPLPELGVQYAVKCVSIIVYTASVVICFVLAGRYAREYTRDMEENRGKYVLYFIVCTPIIMAINVIGGFLFNVAIPLVSIYEFLFYCIIGIGEAFLVSSVVPLAIEAGLKARSRIGGGFFILVVLGLGLSIGFIDQNTYDTLIGNLWIIIGIAVVMIIIVGLFLRFAGIEQYPSGTHDAIAVAGSGIVFMMIHFQVYGSSVIVMIFMAIVGFIYALEFVKTRDCSLPAMSHLTNNFIANKGLLAASMAAGTSIMVAGFMPVFAILMVFVALMVAIIIMMARKWRKITFIKPR
jgi:hypothetical protein